MKKNKFILLLTLLVWAGIISTSCSGDDSNPTPPDPGASEFLGEIDFVKTYGGSDIDEANDVVEADDGGFVIVGSTKSMDGDITDKSDDSNDVWVLKVNAEGEKVWSKTYGGSNDDEGFSINKTNDGGYVLTGYSRSSDGDVSSNEGFQDIWIVKIDGNGNLQWETNHGFLGAEQGFRTVQTSDGGYFSVGFLDLVGSDGQGDDFIPGDKNGSRNNRHGLGEYWGIKLDANGNKEWRRYYGGTNNDRAYDVVQTPDNGYLIVGASESTDFDITDDKGSYDYWVVKVNSQGEKQWTKSFGGAEIDNGFSVTNTSDGNFIFVGDTRSNDQDVSNLKGNADLWAVKLSGINGNIIWERTYGGTQFDSAQSIVPMEDGKYVIAGSSRSNDGDVAANNGQNDAWILVINESGAPQFEMNIGGSDLDFGNGALETSDNKLVLVGETDSNNGDISQNRGIKDLMIAKIK